MKSPMITITYTDKNKRSAKLHLPKTLVCDVSRGIRHLCDQAKKLTFTINEVLGESQEAFVARLDVHPYRTKNVLTEVLACFTMWLYSGIARYEGTYQVQDLWHFGERISSPRFQNAALRELRLEKITLDEGDCIEITRLGNVNREWNFVYAAHEKQQQENEADLEEDFFSEHKMLMFVLDCLVYRGLDHPELKQVLCAGGPLTLQLAKRIAVAPRAGELHLPPWHPNNLGKYLLDESPDDPDSAED